MATHSAATTARNTWVHLDDLRPWEKNPRNNDPAVPKVRASLERFGFVAPIVVWVAGNRMVAGHTRLKAARAILADAPEHVFPGAPGPGFVRVVWHEFATEAEADAYALADNRLGELAEWDEGMLEAVQTDIGPELAAIAGFTPTPILEEEPEAKEPESEGHAVTRVLGSWAIEHGDVREVLKRYPDNHFDALLSDPPYGLADGKTRTWDEIDEETAKGGFMGKAWDAAVPGVSFWREVLRVLKPGAPLVAFFGSRTYHRGVCAIEDAGFDIRDELVWMYGSGFPKSLDVSKAIDKQRAPNSELAHAWDGYGTALKPAHEPAVLARKPIEGTVAQNVARWGVGGLAIDESRVGTEKMVQTQSTGVVIGRSQSMAAPLTETRVVGTVDGRWPANVLLSPESAASLDKQTGSDADEGRARFFYCAKPSRRERELGLTAAGVPEATKGVGALRDGGRTGGTARNIHPTVKPVALARYLARLLLPPEREGDPRRLLVPFNGSGTEVIGGLLAGWDDVTGIEREAEYVEIARARAGFAVANPARFEVADEDEDDEAAAEGEAEEG